MRTDTHCTICQVELPARTSQEGRTRLYCSKDCTNKGYQAMRTARRAAVRAAYRCATCDKPFTPPRASQHWCSRLCYRIGNGMLRAEPHPDKVCALPECGAVFTPKRGLDRCCSQAHGRLVTNLESGGRRRAFKAATATEPINLKAIVERDKNRCHICNGKISSQPYPHPKSRSLDHVIPLSKGGGHTPENVRLCHFRCNVSKGNRGGNEQLLLIG